MGILINLMRRQRRSMLKTVVTVGMIVSDIAESAILRVENYLSSKTNEPKIRCLLSFVANCSLDSMRRKNSKAFVPSQISQAEFCSKKDKTLSDKMLVQACQKGDVNAFDVLIRRHRPTAYSILRRLAPERNDFDDLVQESMIRVFKGVNNIRNPNAFRAWLTQTVTNLFYDDLRRRPSMASVSINSGYSQSSDDESFDELEISDLKHQPDTLFAQKELLQNIENAVSQLPKDHKDSIILREFHGLAYSEIALLTKVEIGTVKSRLCRARLKVQELLGSSTDENDDGTFIKTEAVIIPRQYSHSI
jgi:RNA polymerase sigma-70 factor (ECF subfamily)